MPTRPTGYARPLHPLGAMLDIHKLNFSLCCAGVSEEQEVPEIELQKDPQAISAGVAEGETVFSPYLLHPVF